MYTENCKTLFKEMKEDLGKWKTSCIYGPEDLVLEQIHTFGVLLSKTQMAFLGRN